MKRNLGWIWFFVILACLSAIAAGVGVWYNLRQLLRPAQLADARRLWQEKGPASYQAEYTLKHADGKEDRYVATVEKGKLVSVARNGRVLEPDQYPFGSMDDLFDFIDKQLQADAESEGERVFVTANFDPRDGHVRHYVRSLRNPRERLEVFVELQPAG